MRRIFLVGGIIAIVAVMLSCAGFPQPAEEGNSLVIGSLILGFPDGFYDTPARDFDMNVQITFRNVTQDKKFKIYTNRGYFYFQSNGTDQYVLEEFQLLDVSIGNTKYSFGSGPVNWKINPSPNKVIYLGHIVYTYAAPTAAGSSGRKKYFSYDSSVDVDWNKQALEEYLLQKNGAVWLELETVEYGKKK
jgi:hypothetical protein